MVNWWLWAVVAGGLSVTASGEVVAASTDPEPGSASPSSQGNCPRYCSCFTDPDGYVSANCSVTALGQLRPSRVEMLSFQPRLGYPTHLAPRDFLAFQGTKFLWLVNCSVIGLPNDVFHGLRYVIRLDLSYNKIRHLNGAVFKGMSSLVTLKLRANPLELTPWDAIVSDSIQELDLGQCGLHTIPFGTFAALPQLSRLHLDGNRLRTLSFNTVPSGLRYINLAHNRISNVPTEVLTSMGRLRKLDLSKNPVNCTCNLLIMQDWFSGQGVIFDNGIVCVEPDQYKGMSLSKVNENELCTLEEVKKQRRINEIKSYRESKPRSQNMIHDPDLQSDQPFQNDAEVLFHDDGLTHMELSSKHYPLGSDLSDENNKVASSKQELPSTESDFSTPLQLIKSEVESMEHTYNSSRDEVGTLNPLEDIANYTSRHDGSTDRLEDHLNNTDKLTIINEDWDKLENNSNLFISTTPTGSINRSDVKHIEMVEEGYFPVYNLTDLMMADSEGSGEDPLEAYVAHSSSSKEDTPTSSPTSFTFPVSHADDYSYDSQHDYSAEVTTESFTTLGMVEEGSGEPENETLPALPVVTFEEENTTTSENSVTMDYTTPAASPYSEEYNTSGIYYGSSSDSGTTESSTSEDTTNDPLLFSQSSSVEPSSSEAFFTSTSESPDLFHHWSSDSSSSPEPSSSEALSTHSEIPILSEEFSSSTSEPTTSTPELPRSSTQEDLFPVISTEHEEVEHTSSTTETIVPIILDSPSSTPSPVDEVEIFKEIKTEEGNAQETKGQISVSPTKEDSRSDATLTYVILGLVAVLLLLIATLVTCRKVSRMRPCSTKKKVRLPKDAEANHGTEMQDMLLPKPAENGVKIISQNGHGKEATVANGKEPEKEEEVPVLSQKDWDEKADPPIETVTARMRMLEGPKTPVFIHKTLA